MHSTVVGGFDGQEGTFLSDGTINFIRLIHVHSELSLGPLTMQFCNAVALCIKAPEDNKECGDYIGLFMLSFGSPQDSLRGCGCLG